MYQVIKNYKDNAKLRASFNHLAEKTFGLNFENWYQNGLNDVSAVVTCVGGRLSPPLKLRRRMPRVLLENPTEIQRILVPNDTCDLLYRII